MSHITENKNAVKIGDETTLIAALNAMKTEFEEFSYVRSENGKQIRVVYPKIDRPVRDYHPDGNVRFDKQTDGSWVMSGDRFNCHDEYDAVTASLNFNYEVAGTNAFCSIENYTTTETKDEAGNLVIIARKW